MNHSSIEPEDLLTTPDTPGNAMQASDSTHLGTCEESTKTWKEGKGLVPAFISLQ